MKQLKAIETTKKVDAWNSFMIYLRDTKEKSYTFILPLVNFEVEENTEITNTIFHFDFSMLESKFEDHRRRFSGNIDFTDDPTPQTAGGIVSLGYPLIRLSVKGAKISSYNPMVISCPSKHFNSIYNRCQRESLIKMPEHKVLTHTFKVNKQSTRRSFYIVPEGFTKPLYIVSSITGKFNVTSVDMFDMTTFHSKPLLIYVKEHKTIEDGLIDYEKLKEEWKNA